MKFPYSVNISIYVDGELNKYLLWPANKELHWTNVITSLLNDTVITDRYNLSFDDKKLEVHMNTKIK